MELSIYYNEENLLKTPWGSPFYSFPDMFSGKNKIDLKLIFGLLELFYMLYYMVIYLMKMKIMIFYLKTF